MNLDKTINPEAGRVIFLVGFLFSISGRCIFALFISRCLIVFLIILLLIGFFRLLWRNLFTNLFFNFLRNLRMFIQVVRCVDKSLAQTFLAIVIPRARLGDDVNVIVFIGCQVNHIGIVFNPVTK